jgi:hypothetical protein
MSVVFGEINPWRHRDIVLGSKGIFETVRKKTQNCSVYLNDGFAHMFFDKKNLMTKLVEGLSPQNFVLKILSGTNRVFLPSEVRPSSSRRDRGFASQTRDDQNGLLDPSNPR